MVAWESVVVYLAAFVLVQLAIYRYLRGRDDDDGARMAFAGPPNADRGPSGEPGRAGDRGATGDRGGDHQPRERRPPTEPVDRGSADAGRRCPSCGARNEPEGPYTFCRNCASRLPG